MPKYIPGTRHQQKQEEMQKRMESPWKVVDPSKIALAYKKKAVAKMKSFYEQSQRMDAKLPEILEAVAASGIIIDSLKMNAFEEECLLNYRKKTKNVVFTVEAHKEEYTFGGQLLITPASIRLTLNCPGLKRVTTKSGWNLDHFKITYYKTLVKHDNYLPALVAGRERNFERYRYNALGVATCNPEEVKEVDLEF